MPNSRYITATPVEGSGSHFGSSSGSGRSGSGRSGRGDSSGRSRPATNGELVNIPNPDQDILTELNTWMQTYVSDSHDAALSADSWMMKLMYYLKHLSNGNSDAMTAMTQLMMQYLQQEQNYQRNRDNAELNYQRSLASNQVDLMMAAGMSRAGALAALQGGSQPQQVTADGSITPQGTDIEAQRINKMNAIMNVVQGAAQLAQQIASLATLPFDIKSKSITNQLMSNQNNLLEMQIQGMQDAAMFMQAVANADIQRDDKSKISNLPINEQYSYFADMQGKQFDFAKHNVSSWQYAQSQPFSRSVGNPFFWATLNDQTRAKNYANASVFEPLKAQQSIAHLRAGTEYVQLQSKSEMSRSRILESQAFHDEYVSSAQNDLDLLRTECQKNQVAFDNERALAFMQRVQSFNDLDFKMLDYQIKRILQISDPEIMEQERLALLNSLEYNVANYIYSKGVVSSKNGVLQQLISDPDSPMADGSTFNHWLYSYMQFNEFGNLSQLNYELNKTNSLWRNIFGGAAAAFAGYKIFGSGAAASGSAAAGSYAGYTATTSASGAAASSGLGAGLGILALPLLFRGDSNPMSPKYDASTGEWRMPQVPQ